MQKEAIVNEHPNLALIHAYNDAWIGGDMATAAGYLAEDVTFDSPNQHLRSAEAFIAVLTRFGRQVTGPMAIIAEFADDEQVLMLYDLPTGTVGTVRCCDRFTIKDGKIQTNQLLFDTSPFRQVQAAPPPE
jgi:ketosteroid isomerase-like protein